ncbi:MAG: DUF937 domain-containing protein [Gemmatimonadaceae bacterium]|nr:DUF937 domain-containing protein [Acetobacteraceae bacterium]
MGILDGILGSLLGGSNNASPLQSILGSLLGGGQQGGQQGGLGGLLGGSGLGGLLSKFQQNGMGETAQSWVGTGPNKPVSPDQLQQVFGDQQVDQWAQQANMPKQDLLSQLSNYLPRAVDQMTPNGQVPADPVAGSAFDGPGVDLGRKR